MKRLTKAKKLFNEQMIAVPEWAAEHPKRWHDIGKLPVSRKAAELLAKRRVIEIRQPMNQPYAEVRPASLARVSVQFPYEVASPRGFEPRSHP